MNVTVYCLDASSGRLKRHWLGQANSRISGCPTCVEVSRWRGAGGIENSIYNSHRFPEYLRRMTSASVIRSTNYRDHPCGRCGHAWIRHDDDCAGPCLDCNCNNFVREGELITSTIPSTEGEQNMTPYEYLVLLVDREKSKATVLVEPTLVLASNEEQVKLLAHRAVPEENVEDLNNIVVIIRRWSGNPA